MTHEKSANEQSHEPQPDSARRDLSEVEADVVRLEERTPEELYELAQRLEIPGHAELSRYELIEAIRRR